MTSAEAPPAAHGNAASLSWPRCVDPTDLGKPYKLGFRILATRIELTDKLAENGYPIPLGDDWCGQQDGRITVHPAGTRRRVAAGHGQPSTDKYTIAWELK